MKRYLSMIEASKPEPVIDEEKLTFFISKIAIWDFFNISEATYKAYSVGDCSLNIILIYLTNIMVGVLKKKFFLGSGCGST